MWGSCGKNRAARVITFSSCDRRSVEILDEIEWDNLETRRTRQLATIMYTLKNHIVPDHLAQIFNSTNRIGIPIIQETQNIICFNQDGKRHTFRSEKNLLFNFNFTFIQCITA